MTAPSSTPRPWLITRPAAAGQALTAALVNTARDAYWLPAFEIGAAPDAEAARSRLARLVDVDLAIFVSPAAVRETHRLLGTAAWPSNTLIGAVGAATADVARELLSRPDGLPLTVIAPEPAVDAGAERPIDVAADEADPGSGSEAFWVALEAWRERARQAGTDRPLRRALLLRAAHGRDWLIDRLRGRGIEVEPVAVYARCARPWDERDRAWITQRIDGPPPLLVVTSSEAVDALIDASMQVLPSALPWLRRGRALALHPRIVERLKDAGFADAACVPCTLEALTAAA